MKYRILGKSGLRVSRIGLGGLPIQRTDRNGTREIILAMKEAGVNFIDTARAYKESEEYIGEAIEGSRNSFVLASKSMARNKNSMAKDIEVSLKNLHTDYIDLYQIHHLEEKDVETVLSPKGALSALFEAKTEGKIGHIGVTTHSSEIFQKFMDFEWVETMMLPYNIVENHAEDLISACHSRNIGFINMKPLAGGALDDISLSLRFVFANPDIDVVIPGMSSVEEFKQNLKLAKAETSFSQEELLKINEIRRTLGTEFCRRCNYCAPCSVGINIPQAFILEGYLRRYGMVDWAKSRYAALEHKASDCINCGACESRCPYGLPIRKMLDSVLKTFGE